jgi:hypothetical protein
VNEMSKNSVFVKGAYLWTKDTMSRELTEQEFINLAGKELNQYRNLPFVSLILDNMRKPELVGHINGKTIAINMGQRGHTRWQTMEWL